MTIVRLISFDFISVWPMVDTSDAKWLSFRLFFWNYENEPKIPWDFHFVWIASEAKRSKEKNNKKKNAIFYFDIHIYRKLQRITFAFDKQRRQRRHYYYYYTFYDERFSTKEEKKINNNDGMHVKIRTLYPISCMRILPHSLFNFLFENEEKSMKFSEFKLNNFF